MVREFFLRFMNFHELSHVKQPGTTKSMIFLTLAVAILLAVVFVIIFAIRKSWWLQRLLSNQDTGGTTENLSRSRNRLTPVGSDGAEYADYPGLEVIEVEDDTEDEATAGKDTQLYVMYTRDEVVMLRRMPWDGDSLFAAVAHQRHGTPVGSALLRREAAMLRAQAVNFLRSHRLEYWYLLLEAAAQQKGRYAHLATDEARVSGVLRDLARPRFHPGLESVVALAHVLGAVFKVYVERQDSYTVPQRPRHDVLQELRVAEQFLRTRDGRVVSHFDSVVRVEPYPAAQ